MRAYSKSGVSDIALKRLSKTPAFAHLLRRRNVLFQLPNALAGRATVTRRGKTHIIDTSDPRLRKANLVERVLLGKRFPAIDLTHQPDEPRTATAL